MKIRKIISIILVTFLVICSAVYIPNNSVEAADVTNVLQLKASDLMDALNGKDNGCQKYISDGHFEISHPNMVINLDTTLKLEGGDYFEGNLRLTGDKTLMIKGTVMMLGNLTLDSNAKISINSNGDFIFWNEKNGTFTFDCYGYINAKDCRWGIDGDLNFNLKGGTIVANDCSNVVYAKKLKIESGSVVAINSVNVIGAAEDIVISGGSLADDSKYGPFITSNKNITMNGGDIVIALEDENGTNETSCIEAKGNITINGGEITGMNDRGPILYSEGTVSFNDGRFYCACDKRYTPVLSVSGITLSNDIHIELPEGAVISQGANYKKTQNLYAIYDVTGKPVYVIDIKKKGNTSSGSSSGSSGSGSSGTGSSGGSSSANNSDKKYSNEWVNGKWYNKDGICDYAGTLQWKSNSTGWWVEDSEGWYPVSQWQKIDGKWYYFLESGYMDYSEYRDGYWLGPDGALVDGYYGEWKSDSKGWWFEDKSGWYPVSQWVWINGYCYYFGSDGYMVTNQYVDGYWVGSDGACAS